MVPWWLAVANEEEQEVCVLHGTRDWPRLASGLYEEATKGLGIGHVCAHATGDCAFVTNGYSVAINTHGKGFQCEQVMYSHGPTTGQTLGLSTATLQSSPCFVQSLRGGTTTWLPAAIDAETKLAFAGTSVSVLQCLFTLMAILAVISEALSTTTCMRNSWT